MRVKNNCLFGGFLLLTIVGKSAIAENYIFFNKEPLVFVSDKGELSGFSLEEESPKVDKRVAKEVKKLWSHSKTSSPFQVDARIKRGYIGCGEGLVIDTGYGDDGLLSSKRLQISHAKIQKKTPSRLNQIGIKILESVLSKNNIKPKLIKHIVQHASMTPIQTSPSSEMSLAISVDAEQEGTSMMAFLVVTPDGRGGYFLSKEEIKIGGASDNESYAGGRSLEMHLDLNGDGIEELITTQHAYESFGTSVLQWDGKVWLEISGGGGGC